MLLYSYSDTETIKLLWQKCPRTWSSMINPQYQKTLREFQNIVKYHEESLKKLESPSPNPLWERFLI